MSEAVLILLLTSMAGAIGAVWTVLSKRIAKLEQRIEDLLTENLQLAREKAELETRYAILEVRLRAALAYIRRLQAARGGRRTVDKAPV